MASLDENNQIKFVFGRAATLYVILYVLLLIKTVPTSKTLTKPDQTKSNQAQQFLDAQQLYMS